MGRYANLTHKALLPLGETAALSHLIEKFLKLIGPRAHFVIAVGFCGSDVIDYVELAHPNLSVEFVRVAGFEGFGSGPGASVLACRDRLHSPFYLICCDTLWEGLEENHGEGDRDWIAVGQVDNALSANYCNAQIKDTEVLAFRDKETVSGSEFQAFTGLAHVFHTDLFFRALEKWYLKDRSLELSRGFSALLAIERGPGLFARPMRGWLDIGTWERYESAGRQYKRGGFAKVGELFYLVNGRVIKYFADAEMVSQRVARTQVLGSVIPKVIQSRQHFFSYKYRPGKTLYDSVTVVSLDHFLAWLEQNLWHAFEVSETEKKQRAIAFYRNKTVERVASFFNNGNSVGPDAQRSVEALLARVPWAELSNVVPVIFHGDLQLDNILYHEETGQFSLLDWRQDFAGSLTWGDLYYDLAKLLASIDLDFRKIQTAKIKNPEAVCATSRGSHWRSLLLKFVERRGLDPNRVELLAALIYLNMAGIHTAPSNEILFEEGYRRLHALLSPKENSEKVRCVPESGTVSVR